MPSHVNRRLPGSIWINHGKWYWNVTLPGDDKRRNRPLCMPACKHAMSAEQWPEDKAREAAWRMWEQAVRKSKRPAPRPETPTVNQLCDRYSRHCQTYYSSQGAQNEDIALRLFREMYGQREISSLRHADMIALRDAHIASGICRRTVNDRMTSTKRLVAWALDEALISATVKAELSQVAPLKRGRSEAPEPPPVRPARDEDIRALKAVLTPNLYDMVLVHRLTGMRPAEICSMRWADIEEREPGPWIYRPVDHKNAWRDQPRPILIGPRSREILIRHKGEGVYCFSPAVSVAEWLRILRSLRRTPVQPSQIDRSRPEAMRHPGDHWSPGAYAKALHRAFGHLGRPGFTPNQLRHSFATDIRRLKGLPACRAVLGHSSGERVTDIYSRDALEDEMIATASEAVELIG